MPVEVIDLLSSSSPPRGPIVRPKPTDKPPTKVVATHVQVIAPEVASVAVEAKACDIEKTIDARQKSRERPKVVDNGKVQEWIDLDDETILTYSVTTTETMLSVPLNTDKNGGNKSLPSKLSETANGGMMFTSIANTFSKAQHSDFMYLSDEFDSSINLDKDYSLPADLQLPPHKKRRVTPEPESLRSKLAPLKENGIRRVVSDIAATPAYSGSTVGPPKASGLKRSATIAIDDDPIIFTSSPDFLRLAEEMRRRRRREAERGKNVSEVEESRPENIKEHTALDVLDDDSDLDLPDIGIMASQITSGGTSTLACQKSQKALAAYNVNKSSNNNTATKVPEKRKRVFKSAEEKLAEREAEAERKRLIREGKARDKQIAADLAKVNTLRIDKKVATPEMVAVFPTDLDEKLRKQADGFLGKIGVECEEWDSRGVVNNVLRWKRKVDAKYNERDGHWEPVPTEIEEEKHVLCYMTAAEFVTLGTGDEGQDLDAHVTNMKNRFGVHEIIYLIEGLNVWMRKNRNVRNRQFTDAVRRQIEEEEGGTSSQRARKKAAEYVDEDMIEDALLRLQVMHNVLIHHTNTLVETAEWFAVFTQHISTIPYRRQRMTLDTAFCMDMGQIKTGEDAPDTYVRMLQEVNRITAPIAYGIAAEYPSVKVLVDGLRKEGKDALTHVRKSANKDGAFSDREVGKSVSKRLWGIFMGKDEGSTDV